MKWEKFIKVLVVLTCIGYLCFFLPIRTTHSSDFNDLCKEYAKENGHLTVLLEERSSRLRGLFYLDVFIDDIKINHLELKEIKKQEESLPANTRQVARLNEQVQTKIESGDIGASSLNQYLGLARGSLLSLSTTMNVTLKGDRDRVSYYIAYASIDYKIRNHGKISHGKAIVPIGFYYEINEVFV